MDVFQKIRTSPDLTETDRAIVGYVLDNPDAIAGLTSRELARLTHTSSSAVTRACRRLGFSGFNDLKLNVAADLKRARPGTTELAPNEQALTAAAKTFELETAALAATRQTMDLAAMQQAADLVGAAREVDACAIGPNTTIARHVLKLFMGAGTLVNLWETADSLAYYSKLAPTDHVALMISRGGRDSSVVALAEELHDRAVPTILVTTDVTSPAAQLSTVALGCYYGQAGPLGEMVFSATAGYVINTLAAMLISGDLEGSDALFAQTKDALSARFLGNAGWDLDSMAHV